MQQKNKNLKVIFTLSQPDPSWTGRKGRIKADMVREEIPDYIERIFFICGPPGMVASLNTLLADLGLLENQIKKEDFPGYETA